MALTQLLETLDPQSDRVHRHLWLIALVAWIRGNNHSVDDAVSRVVFLLDQVEAHPDVAARLRSWWQTLASNLDGATLLSHYDRASRNAFVSELVERLHRKCLPASPDTQDASVLFALVFNSPMDALWIAALPPATLKRLAQLLSVPALRLAPAQRPQLTLWQEVLLDAISFCTTQVQAAGFSPDLRLRMRADARNANPFFSLAADCDAVRNAWLADDGCHEKLQQAFLHFCKQLDACRHAASSVYTHLDTHGISMNLVFMLRQLRERVLRIRALLDCLINDPDFQHSARLIAQLATVAQHQSSIGALISTNSSLLAAKIAERSSETGEHYITRNRAEYRTMWRQAAGGGALTAGTTALKFAVFAVGLSAFWSGFWVGVLYAISFVAIQLLHFTLATKQPAMTAPAMAAKLKDLGSTPQIAAFVDEVSHLVRSQVAAVAGNVMLVFPTILLISFAMQRLTGHPMIGVAEAQHVLASIQLLGPSLLFAAFTGVLLFSSSIVAGWVENWFVLHHLDSALRYNPRITRVLGHARADRWGCFMRNHISGLAANISLGLMLGLVPPILSFIGLALDVRHVTLSAGQLGAACASLGWRIALDPTFWWAAACIPCIAVCNVGVSFYLAFRVALQAHNVSGVDRARISSAIFQRFKQAPTGFFWPPRETSGG